eukprot:m.108500 g.108500  ORF g.108500 m.108500 type:complete len:465 (-) comp9007_c0_seq2:101-1495(-)
MHLGDLLLELPDSLALLLPRRPQLRVLPPNQFCLGRQLRELRLELGLAVHGPLEIALQLPRQGALCLQAVLKICHPSSIFFFGGPDVSLAVSNDLLEPPDRIHVVVDQPGLDLGVIQGVLPLALQLLSLHLQRPHSALQRAPVSSQRRPLVRQLTAPQLALLPQAANNRLQAVCARRLRSRRLSQFADTLLQRGQLLSLGGQGSLRFGQGHSGPLDLGCHGNQPVALLADKRGQLGHDRRSLGFVLLSYLGRTQRVVAVGNGSLQRVLQRALARLLSPLKLAQVVLQALILPLRVRQLGAQHIHRALVVDALLGARGRDQLVHLGPADEHALAHLPLELRLARGEHFLKIMNLAARLMQGALVQIHIGLHGCGDVFSLLRAQGLFAGQLDSVDLQFFLALDQVLACSLQSVAAGLELAGSPRGGLALVDGGIQLGREPVMSPSCITEHDQSGLDSKRRQRRYIL